MEKESSEKLRNLSVYLLIVLGITATILAFSLGGNQDKKFEAQAMKYEQAKQTMQKGDYDTTSALLKELVTRQPHSHALLWRYGLSLAAQQKYEEAHEYLVKAREERPFLMRDQHYVMQAGEVFYRIGQYEKAKRYLEEGRKINTSPELSQKVEPLLRDIEQKLQK